MFSSSCPLLLLPPELLGEIFTHAAGEDANAPLILGAVCTAFRRVARSTPGAWTRLRVVVRGDDASSVRKAAHFFRMAGACFVQVDVDMHTNPNYHLGHLPWVLHAHRMRIRALALHTQTVNDAAQFFGDIYPPAWAEEDVPLERLALRSTSDAPAEPPAHLRHRADPPPAPFVSLAHRPFPRLAYLSVTRQPLPALLQPLDNAGRLRELRIVYPLRFAPLSVPDLLQVLHATPLLETLHVDARVTVDSGPPGLATTPTTATSPHTLIPLPHLANLSLRVNNVPAVITYLLPPTLTTLRIDDLDGKRPRAALQTAAALRMLLVRMELPLPGVAEGVPRGLRALDLCGVALAAPGPGSGSRGGDLAAPPPAPVHAHPSAVSSSLSAQPGGTSGDATARATSKPEEDAGALWAWCARRMRMLHELSVRSVDQRALWQLVTPPVPSSPGSTGMMMHTGTTSEAPREDEDVLPALRRLVVADSSTGGTLGRRSTSPFHVDSHADKASFPFTPLHDDHLSERPRTPGYVYSNDGVLYDYALPLAVRTFQQRRPDVDVEYSCARDGGWDSGSAGTVDFLDLYTRR